MPSKLPPRKVVKKPGSKRFKLSTVVSEAREQHPPIEFEMDDGTVIIFDAPQFWSDQAVDPGVGAKETILEVLGEEQYDLFFAKGGTVASFNLVMEAYAEDEGVDLGELRASRR